MTSNEVDGWVKALRQLLAQKGAKQTPAQEQAAQNAAIVLGTEVAAGVLKDIGRIADALETIAAAP